VNRNARTASRALNRTESEVPAHSSRQRSGSDRPGMTSAIYVLTNEAMPGLVKIGRTDESVEARMLQLGGTGVPLPFECYFAAQVVDATKLEKTLHQLFSKERVNPKREFFAVEPERVVLAIQIGHFTDVTPGSILAEPEEEQALQKTKARRPRISLDSLGINPGDTLTFSRDENIIATVVEGGRVLYDGETLSLSAAALRVLHSLGSRTPAASGSEYWLYEDELLDERRRRLEAERFGEPVGSPG
jgi:hypothetical protein